MKRPVPVTAITVVQFLLALLLAGLATYVLLLTRSPEILKEPDAADAIHGLKIGAAVLGVPALILLVAAVGLWRGKMWAWWLALLADCAVAATLVYSVVEDGWRQADKEDIILAACFVIFPILLLLPKVRKFYWRGSNSQLVSPAVEPER